MSELPFPAPEDFSVTGSIKMRLRKAKVPFRANDNIAPYLTDEDRRNIEGEVTRRMQGVLDALIIDTENDHNTRETAHRVAKMFCREIYRGRYEDPPKITEFPNAGELDELYLTGPITIRSSCSHHMCPILGRAWVGIIPGPGKVIGLSKFNRAVDWICARPQIQEEMAVQIADYLEQVTKPDGLAVVIEATHTCMTWRGVKENGASVMTNSIMRGAFRNKPEARAEFLALIRR